MIVYRFAYPRYADDLSGTGAKLYGGRWNLPGIPLLYTSWSISLSLLEVLANAGTLKELQTIQLLELEIPVNGPVEEIKLAQLKKNWWSDFDYSQWMGSEILKQSNFFMLKCPSAIVENEHNYLINPTHTFFKKIKLKPKKDFRFDERLFKTSLT